MPNDLDPAIIDRLAAQLGVSPAEFVRAYAADHGLPAQAEFPAKLADSGVDLCLRLGINPAEILAFRQEIDAQAQAFAELRRDQRSREAQYQARYREERGDDYKRKHAEYMRDYRRRRSTGGHGALGEAPGGEG